MKNTVDIKKENNTFTEEYLFQGKTASVVPSFSVLEDIRYLSVETTPFDSTAPVKSLIYLSDVYLLLNSERIRNFLGEDSYRFLIDSMASSVKSASAKMDLNLSDNDRLSIVKSRYVQSPAEMRAYMIDLDNRFGSLKARIEEELESQRFESNINNKPSDTGIVPDSGSGAQ